MRILVTGASGFVGSNLVRRLLRKHEEVHVIVRQPRHCWRLSAILPSLRVHQVDLSHADQLNRTLFTIKPDVIFHCATYGMFMSVQKDIDLMIQTNITSTKNLLLASIGAGCKKFINTGSSSEYGIKNAPMKETDILIPDNMYGATKAAATIMCTQIAKEKKIQLVTLRLFSPYGPYEAGSRLIPTLLMKKINGEPISLGSKMTVRDFVYIDDVVDAYIAALKKTVRPGEICNIGTGKQVSLKDMVKLFNIKVTWNVHANIQHEPKIWRADIHHTKRVLGWKAMTSLKEGLRKNRIWFVDHMQYYQENSL